MPQMMAGARRFRREIAAIMRVDGRLERHAAGNLDPGLGETIKLVRIVGQEHDARGPKHLQHPNGAAVVALIIVETERGVRIDSVETGILELIRAHLVGQTHAAAFLSEIYLRKPYSAAQVATPYVPLLTWEILWRVLPRCDAADVLVVKVALKFAGVMPVALRYLRPHATFTTLLMSTGLTFGTISALFGLNAGIIDATQFSLLVTVVVGMAGMMVNGLIVVTTKIPSFIATLGMSFFWTGASIYVNGTAPATFFP